MLSRIAPAAKGLVSMTIAATAVTLLRFAFAVEHLKHIR